MDETEENGLYSSPFTEINNDHFAGYVVDDSDLEYSNCSSSDNDDEQLTSINTRESTNDKYSTHFHLKTSDNQEIEEGSDDDFEKEMDQEAEEMIYKLLNPPKYSFSASRGLEEEGKEEKKENTGPSGASTGPSGASTGPSGASTETSSKNEKEDLFYDQIYFDSSSDDDNEGRPVQQGKKKSKNKVRKLTNDELLYDPNMDDEDEKWIQRQRRAYHNIKGTNKDKKRKTTDSSSQKEVTKGKEEEKEVPLSDAVLNCPACLSTLCLDCQRHDVYQNQYRAMFVLNCTIIRNEVLHYKPKPGNKRGKKYKVNTHPSQEDTLTTCPRNAEDMPTTHPLTNEQYNPVKCTVCNTEVAVLDYEQVFHFFNVLASPP